MSSIVTKSIYPLHEDYLITTKNFLVSEQCETPRTARKQHKRKLSCIEPSSRKYSLNKVSSKKGHGSNSGI